MSFIYSVFGFLIAIAILVAVHEFGHFWVARKLGVKVLRFSVGFGKPIWKKVAGDDQIEYVIGAIPLGGYVKMLGEGGGEPIAPDERHRAFDNQPVWKRSLIVLAGPGINFIFAILLFMLLGMNTEKQLVPELGDFSPSSEIAKAGVLPGDTLLEIDGKPVKYILDFDLYLLNQVLKGQEIDVLIGGENPRLVTLQTSDIPIYNIDPFSVMRALGLIPISQQITTTVGRVLEGSAADVAGLQKGDRFVLIDNQPINVWSDLSNIVTIAANKELSFVIMRDGVELSFQIAPKATNVGDEIVGRIGVGPAFSSYAEEQFIDISRNPVQALGYGVRKTWEMSSVTLRMLWKMITGKVSSKNISGPIMIADAAGQAIQIDWQSYFFLLAAISISLGVMNLLPIPMLDGGHLLMYAIEVVAGKSVSENFFAVGQKVGILLLLSLMSLAFYNDIFRVLN